MDVKEIKNVLMSKTTWKQDLETLRVLKKAKLINDRNLYLSLVSTRFQQSHSYRLIKSYVIRKNNKWKESRTRYAMLDFWRHTKVLYGLLKWVNVYSINRCYGGPEEGGWWYNAYTLEYARRCFKWNALKVSDQLVEEYKGMAHGNIYSVLGGLEVAVYIEEAKGQSETTERPYYC